MTTTDSDVSGEAFHLIYSEDERLLRDTCRKYLDTEMPLSGVRRTLDEGLPPGYWAGISALGWPGVVIPEAYEGYGYGLRELAVLATEHGRSVAPGPLLSSSVFAMALSTAGTDQQRAELLPRVAAGELVGSCSLDVDGALGELTLSRRTERTALTLTGTRRLVAEAAPADYVVVDVTYEGSTRLVLIPMKDPAVRVRDMATIDLARRFSEISFDGVTVSTGSMLPADPLCRQHVIDIATVIQCAESVGAAERLLEMTVTHALSRHQFGRPIGSFQAIKHRLADMRIRVQACRAATRYAAWALAAGRDDATRAAHVAKQYGGEAASWVASEALQIHGGIGFTWAHDLHLFLRRIKANELTLGTPDWHARRLADWCVAPSQGRR